MTAPHGFDPLALLSGGVPGVLRQSLSSTLILANAWLAQCRYTKVKERD